MDSFLDSWHIEPMEGLCTGSFRLPGDERISILALVFGAMAVGSTSLHGAIETDRTVTVRRILAQLGAAFTIDEDGWLTISLREGSLESPGVELDCGASAEIFCLMLGVLAGHKSASELVADASVQQFSLDVINLLCESGSRIETWVDGGRLGARIRGNPLYPIKHNVGAGSYFRKTALIAAGMSAVGENQLENAALSSDHAERLLRTMGVNISRQGTSLVFRGEQRLHSRRIKIPGDISLAAPLLVAAAAIPGSNILIEDVGTNPGRTGMLKILSRAGLKVERLKNWQYGNEPVSEIGIESDGTVDPFNVSPNLLPSLSYDIPCLALAASQANGVSHIIGIELLDDWQPGRIEHCCQVLRMFGVDIESSSGTLTIRGPGKLNGAEVQCSGDRAITLAAATAAMLSDGGSVLHGSGLEEDQFVLSI